MKTRREHKIINGIECKFCNKCKLFVEITNFSKNKNTWDGLHCFCFPCKRKEAKIYYDKNSESIILKTTEYVKNNQEQTSLYQKEYRKLNEEALKLNRNEWKTNNRKILREYKKLYERKRRQDPGYRILSNLRNRLGRAAKGSKSTTTIDLIGCDITTLQLHLKNLFLPGMTWENYGKWHIDHIIPCSSFDMTKIGEQKKCFHYTNLQPLWAIDNIKKGSK